jgi:hypothetical protein
MSQVANGSTSSRRALVVFLKQRSRQLRDKFALRLRPLLRPLRAVRLRFHVLRRRYPQLVLLPVIAPTLIMLFHFLPVLWDRLRFELDIEWTEGAGLLHAHRILHGQPLYPKPNSGFMPFPYPPLHPMLVALVAKVFGLSYKVGRGVSLAAICGVSFLLCREVTRAWSGMRWAWIWGVLALGLIVVGYPIAGTFYDLIRTDSLTLFLVVASCVAVQQLERNSTRKQFALCVALMVASLFSKQVALFYIAWLLLFLFFARPKLAVMLGASFAFAAALSVGFGNWLSNGGLLFYTYFNLGKHEVLWDRFFDGAKQLFEFAPYIALMPVAALALVWNGRMSRRGLAWFGMFLAAIPAGLLPFAKRGGWFNNFIPLVVLAGPAALCLLAAALSSPRARTLGRRRWVEATILAYALGVYTHFRSFDAQAYDITKKRVVEAKKLKSFVRSLGERTICSTAPALPLLTGSTVEQTHNMPWIDATWSGNSKVSIEEYYEKVRPDYVLSSHGLGLLGSLASRLVLDRACTECDSPSTLYAGVPLPTLAFAPARKRKKAQCVFEFERGGLNGWTLTGDAFRDVQRRHNADFVGVEGDYFLNSQRDSSDGPRGVAVSPAFELNRRKLSLRIGGGMSPGLRVELVVDGAVVYSETGLRADALKEFIWDVSKLQGKSAQIRAVDEESGSWGHIMLDSVCLEK